MTAPTTTEPTGSTWLIHPRDPLMVRDGKPFSSDPGSRAKSLPFPLPSTVIGAIRTQIGTDANTGEFTLKPTFEHGILTGPPELLANLIGPLLVEKRKNEWHFLAPAPADAIYYSSIHALRPEDLNTNEMIGSKDDLQALFVKPDDKGNEPKGKPGTLPKYWTWQNFMLWLEGQTPKRDGLGHDGPTPEIRTHVKIQPGTQTAEDGFLFQTTSLEFHRSSSSLAQTKTLALWFQTSANAGTGNLRDTLATLGGERRLSRWRSKDAPSTPGMPVGILEQIVKTKTCRLILLTPAMFTNGFMPSDLSKNDVTVKVKAVACSRYQVVSGWDFQLGKPKPTRRLAPAGTVYFLELTGEADAIKKWVQNTWMHNVSDLEQDRRDGFGLAALGVWKEKHA
jgi:CRISPR-associated protein Cmr3